MQTLAIFLLATFCAGALAWVLVYPYLSGEKEAEKRVLSVARSGVQTSKVSSRVLKSRREQVESSLKELEERRKKSRSPPLSIRIAQAGLSWTKRQFFIVSGVLAAIAFAAVYFVGFGALPAALFGFAAGFGLPRWTLSFLKKRRETKFLDRFPDAIDVIVRGIKSGRPLGDSRRVLAS
jgi:tight adherence protein B